jgi:hypothetical protein
MANTNKPTVVWLPCDRPGCSEAFMLQSKDAHDKRFCSKRCANQAHSLPYDKRYYKSPVYLSWSNMKTRCTNEKCQDWHRYGGRGIRVCERWMMFANFLEDMGSTWREGLTLDRINVNGDYTPENCRWADKLTQANNTRTNVLVEFQGEFDTLTRWARRMGLPEKAVACRYYNYGWGIEKTLTQPLRHRAKRGLYK